MGADSGSNLDADSQVDTPALISSVQAVRASYKPEVIVFHGKRLLAVRVNGRVFVIMKLIVEGMGLVWRVQHRKIISSPRYHHMVIPLDTPGGIQETVCIPLDELNGWMFSINPDKVSSDIRAQVIMYQKKCHIVLYNYFEKGAAVNHRFIDQPQISPLAKSGLRALSTSPIDLFLSCQVIGQQGSNVFRIDLYWLY